MSSPSDRPSADLNLLFGILALQMNFIDSESLVAAMNTWVLEKAKPLGLILFQQGKLSSGQLNALDTLMAEHLRMHEDRAENSLKSLCKQSTLSKLLAPIADDELQTTLSRIESNASLDSTGSFRPTSAEAGRYRRRDLYKGGGLGEVYFADDIELCREVALKQIKEKYADDSRSRSRFLLEAEITGGLEHPGIVPVYGLGIYPNGRPYYAMRFIRGDNLKEAIKLFHRGEEAGRDPGERSLAFRQLLRRFIDVCNALAYAHSRAVLHRDLKPANIMLGKFGETLVVDWGLAKWGVRDHSSSNGKIEEERTLVPSSGSQCDVTAAGSGSPPYMSPEQARLEELGPASDIYSLGSTLYTLLTDNPPYRAPKDETNANEYIRARVKQGKYTPIDAVKSGLPAALVAICQKAMSLSPEDRYANAMLLAADLEHWLGDEPVSAYPEPWSARAARWGRRHRSLVASAGMFLVSAVLALSITTWLVWEEKQKTEEQRQLAVEAQQKTEEEKLRVVAEQKETEKQRQIAVRNYEFVKTSRKQAFDIISLIESSEAELASNPALHDRRRELLTTASEACRQILKQEPDDRLLQKQAYKILRYTGNFQRLVNETGDARRSYKEAIDLVEKQLREPAENTPENRLYLAHLWRDYANMQLSLGLLEEATDSVSRSCKITDELVKIDPNHSDYRRAQGLAFLCRANIEYRQAGPENIDRPRQTIDSSVAILQALNTMPPNLRHSYEPLLLASALHMKALIEREAGKLDVARGLHTKAVDLLRGMQGKSLNKLNEADVTHFLSVSLVEQAKTWAMADVTKSTAVQGNIGIAINNLAALQRLYKSIPGYKEEAGHAFLIRGEIRETAEDYENAEKDFQVSVELLKPLAEAHPDLTDLHLDLGKAYHGLGRVALAREREKDAAAYFKKAATQFDLAIAQSPTDARARRSMNELPK